MHEEDNYILRMWRDGQGLADWRYSLEDLNTQEKQAFASLEALYQFIKARIKGDTDSN